MDIGRRDVEEPRCAAAVRPELFAPPCADAPLGKAFGHPFGLGFGVPFDIPAVGGDDDHVAVRTVVAESFDELPELGRLRVSEPLPRHDRVDDRRERIGCAEPLPAATTHPHDGVWRLVTQLAHGVEREHHGSAAGRTRT